MTPVIGLALAGISGPARAQDSAIVQRLIATERDNSDIMDTLEYLSDMIGPRLTGSDNLHKANEWTAQRMREFGLENVDLEPYTISEGWQRGSVEMELTYPMNLKLSAAQMAWTPGTHGTVTGPVVIFAPKNEQEMEQFKGKLHNAVVLTSAASRAPQSNAMMSFGESKPLPPIPALHKELPPAEPAGGPNFMTMTAADRQKFMDFQKKISGFLKAEGVAAVLRDSGKPYDLLNMTGSFESPGAYPTLFVAHEHVAMLQRLIAKNQPVTVSLNIKSKFVHGPVTVYNTVGEIKGSTKPDEIVLVGGHLDSWDLGTGSTDNGTGSSVTLEAAHLLTTAGAKPERTIRFVLFTGEEEGLVGSREYVKAHKADMDKYDVVFIHDTGTGRVKGAWLQDREADRPLLTSQFQLLQQLGLVTSEPNILPGKMNGTDHASFDDAGVPAFAFNQEGMEYGLTHHSQLDTFGMVHEEDLKQGAAVMAILAYNAATMPDRYPRTPAGSN
jgi:Zn-dependent M28 family amino/carboxypeptidase